jgi:hypothetical protein
MLRSLGHHSKRRNWKSQADNPIQVFSTADLNLYAGISINSAEHRPLLHGINKVEDPPFFLSRTISSTNSLSNQSSRTCSTVSSSVSFWHSLSLRPPCLEEALRLTLLPWCMFCPFAELFYPLTRWLVPRPRPQRSRSPLWVTRFFENSYRSSPSAMSFRPLQAPLPPFPPASVIPATFSAATLSKR